jgi:hypothetical protein
VTAFFGLDIPREDDLGGGSIFQSMICLFSITRHYNVNFYYVKPKGVFDPENYGIRNDEWDEKWTRFFNLDDGPCETNTVMDEIEKIGAIKEIPKKNKKYENVSKNHLFTIDIGIVKEWIDKNVYVLNNNLDGLWERYTASAKPRLYFHEEATAITLHVRRFSKADTDPNPIRGYYHPDQGNKSYYHKMMEIIQLALERESNRIDYHIYTQGDLADFDSFFEIKNINEDRVFIHTDESPFEAIHHMVNSDVFVMAKSSLSWVSMVYARNKVIGRKGFWHSVRPGVLTVDEKKIHQNKIIRYLSGKRKLGFRERIMNTIQNIRMN